MKIQKIVLVASLLLLATPALAKLPFDVSVPKEAKLGQEVTVAVKAAPKTHFKIEAQDAGLTQMLNLIDRDADKSGRALWTFRIPKDYKADKMPVIVTASRKGQKAQDKCVNEIEILK